MAGPTDARVGYSGLRTAPERTGRFLGYSPLGVWRRHLSTSKLMWRLPAALLTKLLNLGPWDVLPLTDGQPWCLSRCLDVVNDVRTKMLLAIRCSLQFSMYL